MYRIIKAGYGHYYRLTTRRLFVSTGLMHRRRDQMELLRVKDVFTRQTLVERWLSLGTVVVVSNEKELPTFYLAGVNDPKRVMDLVWHCARAEREAEDRPGRTVLTPGDTVRCVQRRSRESPRRASCVSTPGRRALRLPAGAGAVPGGRAWRTVALLLGTRSSRAMPTVTVEGEKSFEVEPGKKLVLAIEDAGIDIMHRCGGNARCTTCRVQVVAGEPAPMGDLERDGWPARRASGPTSASPARSASTSDLTVRVLNRASAAGVTAGPRPAD